MLQQLRDALRDRPLATLTLIALAPRLLAAFFAGGYFAHDDHFLVIEPAGSWAAGTDYNNWLPWHQGADPRPSGHSFFYVGLHYLLFVALKAIGITTPPVQMVVVRLLHALWSLAVVRAGYRIALQLSGDKAIAVRTGLFLALFWFMPFLAVRNLVEVACIPFLMLGAWLLVRPAGTWRDVLYAGLLFGLAIDVRFQTLFFAAGAGLGLLVGREVRKALLLGLGTLLSVAVVQGGIDLFIWGRPFAEITEYVVYNLANPTTYFDQPWYNYLLLLAGVFVPPLGLGVLFGFFRRPRPLPLWLAAFAFLAFHSWHPNKQERFIFPLLPLFFVLGFVAWEQWRLGSAWWKRHAGLHRGLMRWVWGLNLVLLLPLTFSYSKRSRVEVMDMLRQGAPLHGIIVEDTHEHDPPMLPVFYLGDWTASQVPVADTTQDVVALIENWNADQRPDVVLFFGEEDLDRRMAWMERQVGPLTVEGRAVPGALDRFVHWLNPVNRNETIVITRMQRPR